MSILDDIQAERQRQIEKGYTPEHDDEHSIGELISYADLYVTRARRQVPGHLDQRTDLVKAAAVLLASLESFDRRAAPNPMLPTCSTCRRERTLGDPAHPMDAYDYTPMQALTGQPLGWYSGDDGEVCPECMTSMMGRQ